MTRLLFWLAADPSVGAAGPARAMAHAGANVGAEPWRAAGLFRWQCRVLRILKLLTAMVTVCASSRWSCASHMEILLSMNHALSDYQVVHGGAAAAAATRRRRIERQLHQTVQSFRRALLQLAMVQPVREEGPDPPAPAPPWRQRSPAQPPQGQALIAEVLDAVRAAQQTSGDGLLEALIRLTEQFATGRPRKSDSQSHVAVPTWADKVKNAPKTAVGRKPLVLALELTAYSDGAVGEAAQTVTELEMGTTPCCALVAATTLQLRDAFEATRFHGLDPRCAWLILDEGANIPGLQPVANEWHHFRGRGMQQAAIYLLGHSPFSEAEIAARRPKTFTRSVSAPTKENLSANSEGVLERGNLAIDSPESDAHDTQVVRVLVN
jgi:hypothetical protein